ncbi:DUF1648 domain-containing protein [Paenibacillus sp.]|uniref:DUF1648 domain-containing protein n=1 Tax=Paenibacillus sp. TaxID=58172 RepID=UPI002D4D4F1E|nr:DUF1648 domain-containing protein [Paenibacillus sp.]HZG88367.1 DUF1648 domain-containing protein [Paenibacillus sp.]
MMKKMWRFTLLAAAVSVAASLYFYAELPDSMAVHFGPGGDADDWLVKPVAAFLMPAILLFVAAVLHFTPNWERDESKRRRAGEANAFVGVVVAALLLGIHAFLLAYNLGYPVSASFVATASVGFVFVAIGNMLPRMPQSSSKLLQLPESVYAKYARSQGRVMAGAGLLMLLCIFFSDPARMYAMFFLIVVVIASVIFGSFAAQRRSRETKG